VEELTKVVSELDGFGGGGNQGIAVGMGRREVDGSSGCLVSKTDKQMFHVKHSV
jgi:hypothetical protein